MSGPTKPSSESAIIATLGTPVQEISKPDRWIHKFGDHGTVDGTTSTDLWPLGTTSNADQWYVPAGGVLTVVSTNASDTGLLTVQGILLSGDESTVTVTMTGTTPVVVPGTWKCVYRMGYNGGLLASEPLGIVTALIGAVVVATIIMGDGQTFQCFFVIPAGFTGYLHTAECESGKNDEMEVRLLTANSDTHSWQSKHKFRIYEGYSDKHWAEHDDPRDGGLVLVAGALIKMTATRVAGTRCSASFDIALYEI